MFMGAGVNADPVAAEARESRLNSMAVDNHFLVSTLAGEERLSNPEEVVSILPAELHPRLDPGVNEEIVAQRP